MNAKKSEQKNKMTPKISIVVACYKCADLVPRCLESLVTQTLTDIEIICVNDGSPDNTLDVLNEWADKDSRIKVVTYDKNGGLSHARNMGMAVASAEYITFCDADDYKDPTCCEKMYRAMAKQNVDMVVCGTKVVYEAHDDKKYSDDNYYSLKYAGKHVISEEIVLNTDLSSWNKLFKRSIIEKHDLQFPEGLYYEDAYFSVAYFCVSRTVFFINEQLQTYVRQENSIMSETWSNDKTKDRAIEHLYIAFRLYDFLEEKHLLTRYADLFWRLFVVFGYFALENSKTHQRVKQAKREAKDFVNKHRQSLARAEQQTQYEVKMMISSRFGSAKIKLFVLRFMPTYRLQNTNLLALRTLKNELEQLAKGDS